ncbi:hypothetical protein RUM43_011559 [Polyplax serrata]|uniref:Peptidase S1 domain-containing protein n=1 Tax=Polyplax serrata TaxID=468196 RepID=A0AAN8PUS7_POLSC
MVEIIKLMLSDGSDDTNNGDKSDRNYEIQKVSQEETPNYEILITPNKHRQELKGSQKIKIYVEAADFETAGGKAVRQKTDKLLDNNEKQNIYDVLPLSIESQGGNQQPIPSVKYYNRSENDEYAHKDFESYPSKRQTSSAAPKSESKIPSRSPGIKEVDLQREPSYVDQNNPYRPVTKTEDMQRSNNYGVDYSSSNKRVVPQPTYTDDYSTRRDQNKPTEKEYQRTYERAYGDESVYGDTRHLVRDDLPRDGRKPIAEENSRHNSPLFEDSYRQTGYNREPETRRPSYQTDDVVISSDRQPMYREPGTRPSYPDYEKVNRPVYVNEPEKRPVYVREDPVSEYYEDVTDNTSRPIREDNSGYAGFPESHQPNINHHYSRPLQYEPARAFPASPCLNVFKYEGREPEEDRWYADIYVTTDEVLNGMRLDITLDRPAELLTNWFADVKTKDSLHFTILSLTHKLMPGPAETVRIMVKFNGKKPVPYLKSINLNGRLICPSNRAQKITTKRPVYENPGDLRRTTERYTEPTKRPAFMEEYESETKRTTAHIERRTTPPYEDTRQPTPRPLSQFLKPNPNGYEETDLNSFVPPGKKGPGRPAHSNGKPPPHAAKPAQGAGQGHGQSVGHGQGVPHGQNQGQGNSKGGNKNQGLPQNVDIKPVTPSPGPQTPVECGTPSIQPSPLITHGQLTSRGQWPWHVALYKNVGTDLTFFCGGSLINSKYVLTAAHCVTKTYTTKPLDENTLVVYLGKYHLKLWSEGGVQNRQVSKIYVHSKYNSTDFRSDIAVLALSTPVEYTDYVRPICMWDKSNTRIEEVEGRLGTVVGWGFDEYKMLTEELRQAKMPVVEQKTCLWSYPDFYPQFTSNMTYCAGFKNGTSVCNGDSGGGMVFPYKDRNGVERWYLRGIVSISPARNDSRVCDTSHYVVFTDVAKFLPWLDNFV